ncbi:MAG: SMP-30/gluconolactonase/LRE family protein [Candidatus Aegiribacteria sp.]|nr:SMP-30/gluconolactonase/LRE family protein [Candidatus Aegiribacteria sp.]
MNAGTGMIAVLFLILTVPLTAPSQQIPLQSFLNNPESVVYDPPRFRYLVSNWGNGDIIAIDSLGIQTPFNTEMNQSAGVHIVGNTIYAASTEGSVTGIIGFDLETGTRIFTMDIPEKQLLNDITSDGSEYLYVTDSEANRIYRVRLSDTTYSVLVDSGLGYPNGIIFDESNNRLLVVNDLIAGGPILAVDLADNTLSLVVNTGLQPDGISFDGDGNTYISSWATDRVYRYDPIFTTPPEIVSQGHNNPADIYVNIIDNILAVPNFGGNSLDLVPLAPLSLPGGGTVLSELSLTAYPNPFRFTTTVEYPVTSGVSEGSLRIYNLTGRLVCEFTEPGESCEFTWMGADNTGKAVPPGVYLMLFTSQEITVSGLIAKLD